MGKDRKRKDNILQHIIGHMKKDFQTYRMEFFDKDEKHCRKCDQTFINRSQASQHLFRKHKVLHEKVSKIVDNVLNNTKDITVDARWRV